MTDISSIATHFHFMRPFWLLALLPLAITTFYLLRINNPRTKWRTLIADRILKHIILRGKRTTWFNPVLVYATGLSLTIVALAGPSWQKQKLPFDTDNAALAIILDTSQTMNAEENGATRLMHAKLKIRDLLKLRGHAPTALIVFSGTAHIAVPLTDDPGLFEVFLPAINNNIMPVHGKVIDNGLILAANLLNNQQTPGTILLLTDGATPVSDESKEAIARHQLLILGIGSQAGSSATSAPGHFDEAALRHLARKLNGYYRSQTIDSSDIKQLSKRIRSHYAFSTESSQPWIDMGYWLLFPLVLTLLLWFRRGWTLQWAPAIYIALIILAPTDAKAQEMRLIDLWMTPDQQGMLEMRRGNYATAATRFEAIEWKAYASYLAGDFDAAAEYYGRIGTSKAFFNQGNAFVRGKHNLLALNAYDEALRLDPYFETARINRSIVQSIVDEINNMSASQVGEIGESSKELQETDPRRAEGADRETHSSATPDHKYADRILSDNTLRDMWIQDIGGDPSRFLAAKFQAQREKESTGEGSPTND